jgi:tetratricopeptide (TPR) repeat protein
MDPSRTRGPFPVAAVLLTSLLLSGPAPGQSDPKTAARDHALGLLQQGDVAGALAEEEKILTLTPDDGVALFQSARLNFALHNLDAARGRAERLVKVTGNNATAWELLTQIAQAQGDLGRRDQAIERLKSSIRSAIDPQIRNMIMFIREIVPVTGGNVFAADYFDRAGSDFTRYQFSITDPHQAPDIGLLLRTDAATTEAWSSTALLPPDKQLFHLDMVDPLPGGGAKVALYEYYVGEPDFDTVNARAMQIFRGEAVPLNGDPGSLANILKP